MKKVKFKVSAAWWQTKSIEWIIDNAEFAFTNDSYKGNRVQIVTRKSLQGFNCFEFDNDKHGIIVTSESVYNINYWYALTVKEAKTKAEIIEMLKTFYFEWGASELINPKSSLKSFFNRIRGNHKIVTVNI